MVPPASPDGARDPVVGRTIADKFLIQSRIGGGSMGSIYQADHISLGKTVAIKLIHRHLLGDEELVSRFHREARAASKLKHPNCVQILDFGQAGEGLLYIAMEFIDGQTLTDLVEEEHPLAIGRVLTIAKQVALALDEAHDKGVLHRDLKPDNVMVEDLRNLKDRVRVVDFGIAKLQEDDPQSARSFQTRTGVVCGTPEYMSPEQLRGEKLDHRSDLYAFGGLLYYMLSGDVVFDGDSPLDVAMKHLTEKPPKIQDREPETAKAFQPLLDALLAKKREARPTTALDVHAELERIQRDLAAARHQPIAQSLDVDATMVQVRPPSLDEIMAHSAELGLGAAALQAPSPHAETRPIGAAELEEMERTAIMTAPPPELQVPSHEADTVESRPARDELGKPLVRRRKRSPEEPPPAGFPWKWILAGAGLAALAAAGWFLVELLAQASR